MKDNAFKPDRGDGCEGVRHIPYPAQGDTLIASGGTPTDFMEQPTAMNWTNTAQPSHHISVPWSPLDATDALMDHALSLDYLGTIPRVTDFPSGPGDDDSDPGWM